MKKLVISTIVIMLSMGSMYAQKFAYVDMEYILSNIPEYKAAQEKLDDLSKQWQEEVEELYDEIDKMYKEYQSEKVLLPEEMKQKKEEDIIKKEKAAKELQKKYFGQEGELFKKREELVKPVQDEVYNAVKELSTEGNYALIFDTSAGVSILYNDPKYDKSDEILEKLGYSN